MNSEGQLINEAGNISFVEEGKDPKVRKATQATAKLFGDYTDWELLADINKKLVFPPHISVTSLRPDMVMWSNASQQVNLIELTVPWEDNLEEAHERKKTKYDALRDDCERNGWSCNVLPVEMGCRGYTGRSLSAYLRGIGLKGKKHKRTTRELEAAAEAASSWIWQASHQHS